MLFCHDFDFVMIYAFFAQNFGLSNLACAIFFTNCMSDCIDIVVFSGTNRDWGGRSGRGNMKRPRPAGRCRGKLEKSGVPLHPSLSTLSPQSSSHSSSPPWWRWFTRFQSMFPAWRRMSRCPAPPPPPHSQWNRERLSPWIWRCSSHSHWRPWPRCF